MKNIETLLIEQITTLQKATKDSFEKNDIKGVIDCSKEIRAIADLIFANRISVQQLIIESYLGTTVDFDDFDDFDDLEM